MKTLADLKRAIKPGVVLDLVHYSGWAPGPREVVEVNTVGFGLKSEKGVSYCDWPKAKELKIVSDAKFIVSKPWWNKEKKCEEVVELLTYTIVG